MQQWAHSGIQFIKARKGVARTSEWAQSEHSVALLYLVRRCGWSRQGMIPARQCRHIFLSVGRGAWYILADGPEPSVLVRWPVSLNEA